jgi:hypothetical protein
MTWETFPIPEERDEDIESEEANRYSFDMKKRQGGRMNQGLGQGGKMQIGELNGQGGKSQTLGLRKNSQMSERKSRNGSRNYLNPNSSPLFALKTSLLSPQSSPTSHSLVHYALKSMRRRIVESLRDTLKNGVPMTRLLLETDSPYMTPYITYDYLEGNNQPAASCQPSMCLSTAHRLAEIYDVKDVYEVIKTLRDNARRFYKF